MYGPKLMSAVHKEKRRPGRPRKLAKPEVEALRQLQQQGLEKQRNSSSKKHQHEQDKLQLQSILHRGDAVKHKVADSSVNLPWGGKSAKPSVRPQKDVVLRLNVLQKN